MIELHPQNKVLMRIFFNRVVFLYAEGFTTTDQAGLLSMTLPDKPSSPKQKYQTTPANTRTE